jgi:hypothetical protein
VIVYSFVRRDFGVCGVVLRPPKNGHSLARRACCTFHRKQFAVLRQFTAQKAASLPHSQNQQLHSGLPPFPHKEQPPMHSSIDTIKSSTCIIYKHNCMHTAGSAPVVTTPPVPLPETPLLPAHTSTHKRPPTNCTHYAISAFTSHIGSSSSTA